MVEPTKEDPIVIDADYVVEDRSNTVVSDSREQEALAIVHKYMVGNAAVGLIPVPVFDLLALTGVQIKMVQALARHYNLEFKPELVKSSVMSLIGSLGSLTLGGALAVSAFKLLPIGGVAAAVLALPAVSAGLTYAVGKVFIMHFESGGTLLDFDPTKMHAHFRSSYNQGVSAAKADAAAEAGKKKKP